MSENAKNSTAGRSSHTEMRDKLDSNLTSTLYSEWKVRSPSTGHTEQLDYLMQERETLFKLINDYQHEVKVKMAI